ncbi:MAG: two-component regulator propeller domain-containing protein [Chitinophagales bacterium]
MRLGHLVVVCIWTSFCWGQKLFIKNFTTLDGLSGNTVYNTFQDSRGFIWVCTSQGLSRFNGNCFKNFTSNEGLPSNEIFDILEDRNGRLWVSCYDNKVCYIDNEMVYTIPLTNRRYSSFAANVLSLDDEGNILINGARLVIDKKMLIYPSGSDSTQFVSAVKVKGVVLYIEQHRVSTLKNDTLTFFYLGNKIKTSFHNSFALSDELIIQNSIDEDGTFYRFSVRGDSLYLKEKTTKIPTFSSALVMNDTCVLLDIPRKGLHYFNPKTYQLSAYGNGLPQVNSNYILKDKYGNIWLSTLFSGLYVIPYQKAQLYNSESGLKEEHIQSLHRLPDRRIVVGDYNNTIQILPTHEHYGNTIANLRILKLDSRNGQVIVGGDKGLLAYNLSTGRKETLITAAVKDFSLMGSDSIVVATGGDVRVGRMHQIREKSGPHIIYPERATAVCHDQSGKIWIGTLCGVYTYQKGQIVLFNRDSLLQISQISGLCCAPDQSIWASTNHNGVFCIRNGHVSRFSTDNGLPSNFCKGIYAKGVHSVWVESDKGLTKLSFPFSGRLDKMTTETINTDIGLPTNDVRGLACDGDTVYIGTSKGVVKYMDKGDGQIKAPFIYLTSLSVKGSQRDFTLPISVSYDSSEIAISYSGVALYNLGHLTYKYRLRPIQRAWTYTDNMNTNFVSLPPGDFVFEVQAIDANKHVSSKTASVRFIIRSPIWKRWWFQMFVLLIIVSVVWWLVQLRIRAIRLEEEAKNSLHQQFAQMELQAVAAQMNPHFIFNALSSIQNFYAQNDELAANRYMSAFSRLIRQILDNSRNGYISLADEIALLENYLKLERMRFKGKFDFTINVDESASNQSIILPTLLLQPYIENAINHGLRPLTDRKGVLTISFKWDEQSRQLVCEIDDNGVGLNKGGAKNKDHVSAGMAITDKRVVLLNKIHKTNISIEVIDKGLLNDHGTMIRLTILINNSGLR